MVWGQKQLQPEHLYRRWSAVRIMDPHCLIISMEDTNLYLIPAGGQQQECLLPLKGAEGFSIAGVTICI